MVKWVFGAYAWWGMNGHSEVIYHSTLTGAIRQNCLALKTGATDTAIFQVDRKDIEYWYTIIQD